MVTVVVAIEGGEMSTGSVGRWCAGVGPGGLAEPGGSGERKSCCDAEVERMESGDEVATLVAATVPMGARLKESGGGGLFLEKDVDRLNDGDGDGDAVAVAVVVAVDAGTVTDVGETGLLDPNTGAGDESWLACRTWCWDTSEAETAVAGEDAVEDADGGDDGDDDDEDDEDKLDQLVGLAVLFAGDEETWWLRAWARPLATGGSGIGF